VNEKTITNKIKRWFKAKGGVCHKVFGGPMNSGFPDLIGCIKGRTWIVEVKVPGAKARINKNIRDNYNKEMKSWMEKGATLLQAKTLQEWKKAGAVVLVVSSVEELEEEYNRLY